MGQNSLFKKLPFINNGEDANVEIREREGISPRNSKPVTIGNPHAEATKEAKTQLVDMSADICMVKDIQLNEDMGRQMLQTINRLKAGQIVVADFSSAATPQDKNDQFSVLWGAIMALNGHYKKIDNDGNFYIFSSDANQITEDSKLTREN